MPVPSLAPLLAPKELQERLRLAKTLFDENVETLRAEFDCVQQQAHELAIYVAQTSPTRPIHEVVKPSLSEPADQVRTSTDVSSNQIHHVHEKIEDCSPLEDEPGLPAAVVKQHTSVRPTPTRTSSDFEVEIPSTSRFEKWLNILPAFVIVVNALVIGISLDFYRGHIAWQILEYFFVLFYSLEMAVKVGAYGWCWYWCGPDRAWNLFDFSCLLIMYVDAIVATTLLVHGLDASADDGAISSLNLMKIFRLARLARLVRALRFRIFYELKLIVLGVFSGLRVICWAILLLVVLVYAIGVAMRNFVGDEEQEFQTVLQAMFTCFRCFTEGCDAYNGTPLPERLRQQYGGAAFVTAYIFVTMLINVGVFNLIMAVFIENVMSSQHARKQNEISETALAMELKIKDKVIRKLGLKRNSFRNAPDLRTQSEGMNWILEVGGRSISREEFALWLQDSDFMGVLDEASIDTSGRVALFDVLDADGGGELSVEELITGLMSLRGPVTKGDVIGINLKLRYLVRMTECFYAALPQRPTNLVDSAVF